MDATDAAPSRRTLIFINIIISCVGVMGTPSFPGLTLSSASACMVAVVLLAVCVAFVRDRKAAVGE